jgi:hypothetical protein
MSTVTVPVTLASRKADRFLEQVNARISRTEDPKRYTAEKRLRVVGHGNYRGISAVVSLRDDLTGGHLWVQWVSYFDRPNSGRFLGGRYCWTLFSKSRRIKKSYRSMWSYVNTFIF